MNLELKIGYYFNNKELLENALRHPSFAPSEFERLEFLGDRILGLVLAKYLFEKKYPIKDLARIFANLVNKDTLQVIAKKIEIKKHLKHSIENISPKVLTDALEAILGAIYLEAGYEKAKQVILNLWKDMFEKCINFYESKMYLQELVQFRNLPLPIYRLIEVTGTCHEPLYKMEVVVEKLGSAVAIGSSKQEASKKAAQAMIENIRKIEEI